MNNEAEHSADARRPLPMERFVLTYVIRPTGPYDELTEKFTLLLLLWLMVQPTELSARLPRVVLAVLHAWPSLKFNILLAFGPIDVTMTLTLDGLLGGTAPWVALPSKAPVLTLRAAMTPRLFLPSSPL